MGRGGIGNIWQFTEFFRKYGNLQKLSNLNITISEWQLFWKFSKYDNLQYDNCFLIFRNMTILIFLNFWDAWIYIAFATLQNFSHWKLSYLKYDNLNMTIFLNIFECGNLQYDNYFEIVKIWQFAIWQLFRKNCHIWNCISKYDKKNIWQKDTKT